MKIKRKHKIKLKIDINLVVQRDLEFRKFKKIVIFNAAPFRGKRDSMIQNWIGM